MMDARAWFSQQSFNGRHNVIPEVALTVRILGCDTDKRIVYVSVSGQRIELAYGPLDRIPSSEEIIRRARQAYRSQ